MNRHITFSSLATLALLGGLAFAEPQTSRTGERPADARPAQQQNGRPATQDARTQGQRGQDARGKQGARGDQGARGNQGRGEAQRGDGAQPERGAKPQRGDNPSPERVQQVRENRADQAQDQAAQKSERVQNIRENQAQEAQKTERIQNARENQADAAQGSDRIQNARENRAEEAQKTERIQNARENQASQGSGGARPARAQRPALRSEWNDAQVLGRMADEERIHRERMAKIEALRGVAQRGRDQARLDELTRLEQMESQRYDRLTSAGRRTVGSDRFDRLRRSMLESAKTVRQTSGAR